MKNHCFSLTDNDGCIADKLSLAQKKRNLYQFNRVPLCKLQGKINSIVDRIFSIKITVFFNVCIWLLFSLLFQFKLEPMVVGSIYLCLFLSYGISSPLSGHIADRVVREKMYITFTCWINTDTNIWMKLWWLYFFKIAFTGFEVFLKFLLSLSYKL